MKENFLPYSIYVNHRPFRVTFLVNPDGDQAWLDRVFEYNRGKWGGRCNQIIFTDGNTIEEGWWKFLREYDPDIVYSTVQLSDNLKKRIHIFCSPLSIDEIYPDHQYIHLSDDPISILPTSENISMVARDILDSKSSLAIFEFDDSTPQIIKKFIIRNFGVLETGQSVPYHIKKSLEGCQTKTYKITDFESLNKVLLDLGEFRNRVVFPAQICSLPNSFKDVEYNPDNEKFAVIVGDSPSELAYLWNRTMAIPRWMRTGLTQLWLPKELVQQEILIEGLAKFINRYTGSTGNNNNHGTSLITFSLSEEEMSQIMSSFNSKMMHPRTYNKLDQFSFPNFGQRMPLFFLKRSLELHRAHSNEEHLILEEPDVKQGVMAGQYWFSDIYIQFRPELFTNILGKDYWWQLPQRNNILYESKFFNKPARINSNGTFSVLMRRQSRMDIGPDEDPLIIKIPDDRYIFANLICGESFDYYQSDGRGRFLSNPFYTIQRSDKGMYLSGVLSLFPDLLNAHYLFEKRYWRKIFERMANQSDTKDKQKKSEIVNIIKKGVNRQRDFKNSDEDVGWLAEKVLNFAKYYSKEEVDLNFAELIKMAKKETDEYNDNSSGNKIIFNESEYKDAVSGLVALKILLLGIRPKCPRCGYRIWYHVDEVTQGIICKGCGHKFTIDAEEKWYYRLNSLIRAATSLHGTIPILLVLGQLMNDARSSFMFIPCTDLFNKDNASKDYIHWGEIDIVCIKDGKFIIGEIKQSVNLFDQNDFDKMLTLAKLIKPDIIIFSSMNKDPSGFVKNNINKLKTDLADLEINVQWYPLNYWIFDARPAR